MPLSEPGVVNKDVMFVLIAKSCEDEVLAATSSLNQEHFPSLGGLKITLGNYSDLLMAEEGHVGSPRRGGRRPERGGF